jgi:hypoxanthine phosphoribosyltransferase
MSDNIKVSWEEVEQLVSNVANKMLAANFKPDIIVTILRGGVVPARLLCNYFDEASLFTVTAKLYEDDWQASNIYMHNTGSVKVGDISIPINGYGKENIFVMDDVSDSGKTFRAVLEEMHNKYSISYDDGTLRTASLYVRTSSSFLPIFYGEKVDHEQWFDFPWEKK